MTRKRELRELMEKERMAAVAADEANDIDGAIEHLRALDAAEQQLRLLNEDNVVYVDFGRDRS